MKHPALITTAAGLAALLALFSQLRRHRATARKIQLIHEAVEKNLQETLSVHRTLYRTRGAINQLHQYIDPVPKGV